MGDRGTAAGGGGAGAGGPQDQAIQGFVDEFADAKKESMRYYDEQGNEVAREREGSNKKNSAAITQSAVNEANSVGVTQIGVFVHNHPGRDGTTFSPQDMRVGVFMQSGRMVVTGRGEDGRIWRDELRMPKGPTTVTAINANTGRTRWGPTAASRMQRAAAAAHDRMSRAAYTDTSKKFGIEGASRYGRLISAAKARGKNKAKYTVAEIKLGKQVRAFYAGRYGHHSVRVMNETFKDMGIPVQVTRTYL